MSPAIRTYICTTLSISSFLFISPNSSAESTDIYSGNNYGSIDEFIDQGGARYAGEFSPANEITDGNITTYQFDPENGPKCLSGSEFSMSIRDQKSENLMIHLGGGGVCWSEKCMAFEDVGVLTMDGIAIMNPSLEYNPVKDWNHVFVPYCDGSLFLGDAEFDTDSDGVSDRFQYGLRNISATLDVTADKFPSPKRILLTGSSGGGYGTIFTTILLRYYYPDTPIDVVDDAGVGISKPGNVDFTNNMVDEWNAAELVPKSCEDCFVNGHMSPVVDWILNSDDNIRFGMMTSRNDFIIGTMYLELSPKEFANALIPELEWLQERHPERFHYFLKSGTAHTFLMSEASLSPSILLGNMGNEAGGITAVEWVENMVTDSSKWDTTISTPLDWILPTDDTEDEDVSDNSDDEQEESSSEESENTEEENDSNETPDTNESTDDSGNNGGSGTTPSSLLLILSTLLIAVRIFKIFRKTSVYSHRRFTATSQ